MKAQQVANQIALAQAVAEHQLKKIFTFHRNVASARSFTSERGEGIGTHRLDELSADAVNDLTQRLEEQFPGRSILRMSAKSGDDFTAFCEILEQRGDFGKHVMDVDYDIYAEGEAELGWLNSQIRVTTAQPFELDELLLDIIRRLRTEFSAISAETAHLKTIGLWEGFYGVANLVSSFTEPELSLP